MWTPIQGPEWAFDVITPPCVELVEHHALVEGIATAVNNHEHLIALLQEGIEHGCYGNLRALAWKEKALALIAKAKGSQ